MTTFNLAWGSKLSAPFKVLLIDMCQVFNWQPQQASDLTACMAWESGETFSPSVKNAAGSGAVGLIQFMPATAIYLGTTTTDLAAMSAYNQLEYVEKYFKPYAKHIKNLSDLYMAILMPKYIGQPESAVLFDHGTAYLQNRGLDVDHDGKITKAEATAKVQAKLTKGMLLATTEDWS